MQWICVLFIEKLIKFLDSYDEIKYEELIIKRNHDLFRSEINEFFCDDTEVIYIPAGRSMMTLFSSQLMYMYSVMSDDQKRSLDFCTQEEIRKEQIRKETKLDESNFETFN